MDTAANLVLVGPMGAGKSVVGRRLAARLGRPFVDLDAAIEADAGRTVAAIFADEGEPGFRVREAAMLAARLARRGQVIATGGGVVLDAGNRRLLQSGPLVAWLRTGVEAQRLRLQACTERPLLQVVDPAARLQQLARERTPLYAQVASLVLDTDALDADGVVAAMEAMLLAHGAPAGAVP
jgi:shikimate kinase